MLEILWTASTSYELRLRFDNFPRGHLLVIDKKKLVNYAGNLNDNLTFRKKVSLTTSYLTNSWTLLVLFSNTFKLRTTSQSVILRTSIKMKRAAVLFGILFIFFSSLFISEGLRRRKKGDEGRITKVN